MLQNSKKGWMDECYELTHFEIEKEWLFLIVNYIIWSLKNSPFSKNITNNNDTDVTSLKICILFKLPSSFGLQIYSHSQRVFSLIAVPFIEVHHFVWNGGIYNA